MAENHIFAGRTDAQTTLVEYWQDLSKSAGLPSRYDFDPGFLRGFLADISIIEIDAFDRMRFRISGSGIRSILGRDMSGHYLDELHGDVVDMLALGLSAVLDRNIPVGGLIERERDRHAWLRLPLLGRDGYRQILCHDALLSKTGILSPEDHESLRFSSPRKTIAA